MSKFRVLVGTRKGAFVLTSDGKRQRWDISGPHFAGWEIYHIFRSTCMRTSRTPSTSFRSRATPSTIRPRQSCAYTAAGPAETSGRCSPGACHKATATSTCCATRWPSTRWKSAGCISAPPAARCTGRPTGAIAGLRSCGIFRPSFLSRSRRCHDPRRASVSMEAMLIALA